MNKSAVTLTTKCHLRIAYSTHDIRNLAADLRLSSQQWLFGIQFFFPLWQRAARRAAPPFFPRLCCLGCCCLFGPLLRLVSSSITSTRVGVWGSLEVEGRAACLTFCRLSIAPVNAD